MRRLLAVALSLTALSLTALAASSAEAAEGRAWTLTQRKQSHVLTYGAPGDLGVEFSCKAGASNVAITTPGERKIFLRLRAGNADHTIMSKLAGGLRTGHMKTDDPVLIAFRATWSVQLFDKAPFKAETDADYKAIAGFFDICPPR